MNINISKCRFKNFNFNNVKIGDYVIESGYLEPYVLKVIEINGYEIKLKPIAYFNMTGKVFVKNLNPFNTLPKSSDYIRALKVLTKKYTHEINKLIVFH